MKITIEIIDGHWVVTQKNKETKIFILWRQCLAYLEDVLTNKNQK